MPPRPFIDFVPAGSPGQFPWGFVDGYLPASELRQLEDGFIDPGGHPSAETLGRGKKRLVFRAPPLPPIVDEAGPAWSAAVSHWCSPEGIASMWGWARAMYKALNPLDDDYTRLMTELCSLSDEDFDLRFEFSSLESGAWLPPHTDAPDKVVSCVLYLPPAGWDPVWGGQTVIYRPSPGQGGSIWAANWMNRIATVDAMEVVEAVPYTANRLFWFLKSPGSWHGVAPVSAPTGVSRRSFNFSLTVRPEAVSRPALAAALDRVRSRETGE